ncbi:MAG: LysR family transcriptional regulator [Clostridia bacterium]
MGFDISLFSCSRGGNEFYRAAERLHIAQPPLRQIQELETELDAKLFIRKPHASTAEEGVLFRQYAQQILELVKKSSGISGRWSTGCGNALSGVSGRICAAAVSEWIAEFHQVYPHVT